jgi:diguanylate cyclase (GGDEF)-like protein
MQAGNSGDTSQLQEELRNRLARLRSAGAWELGLGAAVIASVLGMVACAFSSLGDFRVDIETSGVVFFAFMSLFLLLAWLARDRGKRLQAAEFEVLGEMINRHLAVERAVRDPLTGAYNRAAMLEFSRNCFRRAERYEQSLALAVLDLDDFHNLNNRYGHSAGDLALVQFSRILHESSRGSDLVARWGGDEFVLLLSDTGLEGAAVVMQRIENRLRDRNEALGGDQLPLRCSWGAALFEPGLDWPALFEAADRNLLANKDARQTSLRRR